MKQFLPWVAVALSLAIWLSGQPAHSNPAAPQQTPPGSFVQYVQGTKFQQDRGSSPGVISSGGKIVWLSPQSALVDSNGKSLRGDFDGQAQEVFARIDRTLKRAGGSVQNVVVWTIYMNEDRYGPQFGKLRHDLFPNGNFPGSARIVVSNFEKPGVLIEIQAVAVIADRRMVGGDAVAAPASASAPSPFSVQRLEAVKEPDGASAPAVVSQGGKIVWLSGQSAASDSNGKSLAGDFDAQAKVVFARIDAILKRAGGSLKDVVSWTVFVNDPRYGEQIGKLRPDVFAKGNFPGNGRIVVSNFEKPGMLLEIQAVAVVPDQQASSGSPMAASVQYLDGAQDQESGGSPAVITEGGKAIWLIGETGGAAGSGDFQAHVRSTFDAMQKNLGQDGASLKNLVSLKVFIKATAANCNDFAKILHDTFPDGKYPATTVVNVAYSPELIEIQGVAVVP